MGIRREKSECQTTQTSPMNSFKLPPALAGCLVACALHASFNPILILAGAPPDGRGFEETFTTNPAESGWAAHGEADLFAWDGSRQALRVTWDSSRTNSYYHRPLGVTLSAQDDFAIAFDLVLLDIKGGSNPLKPSAFQIAVGLMNSEQSRRPDFFRGAGLDSATGARSLLEWNYFPDTGFGTTVSPGVFSSNNLARFSFAFPFDLTPLVSYRIEMEHIAAKGTLITRMLANGKPTKEIQDVVLPDQQEFDFRLDSFAVSSYSDAGQSGEFDGSVLARGWVDNVLVVLPPPLRLVPSLTAAGLPGIRFTGRQSWRYLLERSEDLVSWTAAGEWTANRPGEAAMTDPAPPAFKAFYRVIGRAP